VLEEQGVPAVDLLGAATELHRCDGYVVLVVDPQTGEADAHGPHSGLVATLEADRMRTEFDRAELTDVSVYVVRLHRPRLDGAGGDRTP